MEKEVEKAVSKKEYTQNLAQKILLYNIYALILLMIIFSLLAIKDKNFAGYQECVQKKCERGGPAFCQKAREQNNCCLGAGGQLSMTKDNTYTCIFS